MWSGSTAAVSRGFCCLGGTEAQLKTCRQQVSPLVALPRALPVPWPCDTSVCLFLPSASVGAVP